MNNNIITDEYKKNISNILNKYTIEENWAQAKKLLENELKKEPNDHWLLTQISEVYYEMRNYQKAIELSKKAIELAPECPLVLNDHALHLYMHEEDDKAIKIWDKLLKKGVEKIAQGECGEGLRNAKSLLNDVRIRIGKSYLETGQKEKALNYFQEHLNNRQRGLFSNFTKKEVEAEIKNIEKS